MVGLRSQPHPSGFGNAGRSSAATISPDVACGHERLDMSQYTDLLVYSDDASVRQAVIRAVGRRAGKGLAPSRWTEAATPEGVRRALVERDFATLVLDGEAAKLGGMGLAKELAQELEKVPPVIVLVARQQDEWLATWSGARAVVSEPLNPLALQEAIAAAVADGQAA